MSDPRKIFLVHGRDWTATNGMAALLRSLGLEPVRWPEAQVATGKPSPTFTEILDKGFEMTAATVVLLTPDEETYLRLPMRKSTDRIEDVGPVGQSRPTVLYELGWAMRHKPDRTVAVRFGTTRIPSDLFGRHMVLFAKYTDESYVRDDLSSALMLSACTVDKRSDWTTAGSSELRAAVNQYTTATTSWIEAGTNIRMTRYRYDRVMDIACRYVLMTGHNFGDQFGTREDPTSPLYDNLVRLLLENPDVRINLVFAPPALLRAVHPLGYKDLVEKSLPRMWDLTVDPRLAAVGHRLRIFTHRGAMFLSAFVRDPEGSSARIPDYDAALGLRRRGPRASIRCRVAQRQTGTI